MALYLLLGLVNGVMQLLVFDGTKPDAALLLKLLAHEKADSQFALLEAIANTAELVGSSGAWIAAYIGRHNIGGLVESEPLTLRSDLAAQAREVAALRLVSLARPMKFSLRRVLVRCHQGVRSRPWSRRRQSSGGRGRPHDLGRYS